MKREKLKIAIPKLNLRADKHSYESLDKYMQAMVWYHINARKRYVDRLTKKQQAAINLIRIMSHEDFVEGVGGKTKLAFCTMYILDC